MATKRYNLVLPEELYEEVEGVAFKDSTTVVDVLRRFIKLGLLVEDINRKGGELFIREGDQETRVIVLG